MTDLLIPSHIAVNRLMAAQANRDMEEAKHWTEELRRIDPSLSVEWVPEQATEFDNPGRWHVRKRIPGDFDEWWPLITSQQDVEEGRARVAGAYKPPGAWLLNALKAADLWNPNVHRSKKEARAKHREAKIRQRQREAEQRQDEMALANRAARRIRDDRGMKHRSDLKRKGIGIKRPNGGVVLPPGVKSVEF